MIKSLQTRQQEAGINERFLYTYTMENDHCLGKKLKDIAYQNLPAGRHYACSCDYTESIQ